MSDEERAIAPDDWNTAPRLYSRALAAKVVSIADDALERGQLAADERDVWRIREQLRRDLAEACYEALGALDAERDRMLQSLVKRNNEAIRLGLKWRDE